jgi:hypothetical protein
VSRLRYSIVLLALAAVFGVGVPCAGATDPFPTSGITTLQNDHFMVHYNRDDTATTAFITQEKAGSVAGMAKRAYDLFNGSGTTPDGHPRWGFAAPTPNANGLFDISVDDLCLPLISFAHGADSPNALVNYNIDPSIPVDAAGHWCRWDALLNTSVNGGVGEIHLSQQTGLSYHVIAHQVFHLFEQQMAPNADAWLKEGSAEWAAFSSQWLLTPTEADLGVNPDRTADCVGSECGDTELDKNGYPGWLLFEYLSERFTPAGGLPSDIIKTVWQQAASSPTAVDALATVLTAHGTTMSQFYNDFATARLWGNFTPDAINGKLPPVQASLTAPDVDGTLPTADVAVNHLAARYVAIHHGDPANLRAPCYAATLNLNVAIPAGVTSTPYFYANTYGAAPQAFTVTGSTAKLTVPDWNTCAGSPDAYVSLPNDSWGAGALDGREFELYGDVSVDEDSPASPSGPSGAVVTGPVIETPSETPAPTLKLYAPEVLRVNASNRLLRFVVFASGEGQLHAVLGPTDLGKADLRTGNNDIRFTLPKNLVTALRKTSALNLLRLTSVAPNGDSGNTITRRVMIQPAPKKKKKTVKHH